MVDQVVTERITTRIVEVALAVELVLPLAAAVAVDTPVAAAEPGRATQQQTGVTAAAAAVATMPVQTNMLKRAHKVETDKSSSATPPFPNATRDVQMQQPVTTTIQLILTAVHASFLMAVLTKRPATTIRQRHAMMERVSCLTGVQMRPPVTLTRMHSAMTALVPL